MYTKQAFLYTLKRTCIQSERDINERQEIYDVKEHQGGRMRIEAAPAVSMKDFVEIWNKLLSLNEEVAIQLYPDFYRAGLNKVIAASKFNEETGTWEKEKP